MRVCVCVCVCARVHAHIHKFSTIPPNTSGRPDPIAKRRQPSSLNFLCHV